VIDPPLWLVILPVAASPLVYVTRRWGIGVLLAALVAFSSGLLAWNLPPTNPIRLLGRPFLLDALTQHILALLFILAAFLFLAAWQLPQRRSFLSFGLILLGLFAAAGMARHLGFAALTMIMAAIVAVPVIQAGQSGTTRAAWRFLVMLLMALPFFLLASWRVDLYREDVENAVYLSQAALFLALGMAIWLAAVPLHGWLTGAGTGAPPLAAVLLLAGFPALALVTLLHVLGEAAWFTWSQQAGRLLLAAGLLSLATGGLMSAIQRGLRPLLGYAALFDLGCLLVALAAGGEGGALAFYAGLAVRGLGLALAGAATAAVSQAAGGDGLVALRGAAYRAPLAAAALLVGGFTLAGLPLTVGFFPRWFLAQQVAQVTGDGWTWLIAASGLAVSAGYLRAARAMLVPAAGAAGGGRAAPSWLATGLLAALALLSLGLGLFPGPLFALAEGLLRAYPLPPL
jgi:multicomponent Na+:H+ antiporter subunit D